jgi:hypothetical protein
MKRAGWSVILTLAFGLALALGGLAAPNSGFEYIEGAGVGGYLSEPSSVSP